MEKKKKNEGALNALIWKNLWYILSEKRTLHSTYTTIVCVKKDKKNKNILGSTCSLYTFAYFLMLGSLKYAT